MLSLRSGRHALMAIVVSFFVVARVNTALAQYKQARLKLSGMFTVTRDLVAVRAIHTKDDKTQGAKEWRNRIAYYSCLLLRLAISKSSCWKTIKSLVSVANGPTPNVLNMRMSTESHTQ